MFCWGMSLSEGTYLSISNSQVCNECDSRTQREDRPRPSKQKQFQNTAALVTGWRTAQISISLTANVASGYNDLRSNLRCAAARNPSINLDRLCWRICTRNEASY